MYVMLLNVYIHVCDYLIHCMNTQVHIVIYVPYSIFFYTLNFFCKLCTIIRTHMYVNVHVPKHTNVYHTMDIHM